jgi:hypothetical protein
VQHDDGGVDSVRARTRSWAVMRPLIRRHGIAMPEAIRRTPRTQRIPPDGSAAGQRDQCA